MGLNQRRFENLLIVCLVGACTFSPWAAAVGLLFVVAGQVAERFFTRNISDPDREAIAHLRSEVDRHKSILNKEGLAKALGGPR